MSPRSAPHLLTGGEAAPRARGYPTTKLIETVDLVLATFVPVRKTLDPNDPKDYLKILANLAKATKGLAAAEEAASLRKALDKLKVDWTSLDESARAKVLNAAKAAIAAPGEVVAGKVVGSFAEAGKRIAEDTRASAADQFKLKIEVKLSAIDQRVIDTAADSQGNYIRDEFGRRSEAFSQQARDIVSQGLKDGLGTEQIADKLGDELADANRAPHYWNMISSAFANRARTYSNLSSYDDAGIEWFVFEAVLDERTSNVCRFMHGKRFEVASGLKKHRKAEGGDVTEVQPWVSEGVDDDGNAILYHTTADGGRRTVASIDDSAEGEVDERGSFSGAMSDKALAAAGIMQPPLHGNCRSTILPEL